MRFGGVRPIRYVRRMKPTAFISVAALLAVGAPAAAQQVAAGTPAVSQLVRGEDLFAHRCMDCHDPPAGEATPARAEIASYPAADLVAIMETGRMVPYSEGLTHADTTAIAAWLTQPPPQPPTAEAETPPPPAPKGKGRGRQSP